MASSTKTPAYLQSANERAQEVFIALSYFDATHNNCNLTEATFQLDKLIGKLQQAKLSIQQQRSLNNFHSSNN